jgi:hypothetical protein
MAKVEFRRNHAVPLRAGTLRRRSLVLLLVVAFLLIFALFFPFVPNIQPTKTMVIKVSFVQDSLFLIQQDTTNYEGFASVLMKQVKKHKNVPVEVLLHLPKEKTYSQVSDIVQIVNALDAVKMRLISEP